MQFLNRMSIRDRLAASLPIVLVLFSSFGLFAAIQSSRLGDLTQDLLKISTEVYGSSLKAAEAAARIDQGATELISAKTDLEIQEVLSNMKEAEGAFLGNLETINGSVWLKGDEDGRKLIEETRRTFSRLKSIRERAVAHIQENASDKAAQTIKKDFFSASSDLKMNLKSLNAYGLDAVEKLSNEAKAAKQRVWHVMVAFVVGFSVFSLFLLHLVLNSVMSAITQLHQAMRDSTITGQLCKAELTGKNEIVEMAGHFNELVDQLNDQLWLRDGLNRMNSDLSGGIPFREITRISVSFAARYTKACAAAMYLYNSPRGTCELSSSFAFSENQHFAKKFKLGEGVVGQVAVERKPILLNEIKSESAVIKSATVTEPPRSIYVAPLIYHNDFYGVLEVAFFGEISEAAVEFLDSAASVAATFLSASFQRKKIRELLTHAQEANEQLQMKSDELNAANEEMTAVNEELTAQTEELQAQAEELKAQTEELERQRLRAEEADRLKSEFLSNMSHELRTPLNSVMALSQLMISRGVGKNPEQEEEYLKVIERNGRQLLTLINDILDLSKIESGRMDLRQSEFDPKAAAVIAIETIRPMAINKGLSLVFELKDVGPIYSDKDKLQQILLNLLSNAVKFTEKGSVTIILTDDEENVFFTISDTGIGIPQANLDSIFDEFRQVDGSMTRRHEGTGLGLAICKKLTTLLGGEISVESTVGNGTEVRLSLLKNDGGKAEKPEETNGEPIASSTKETPEPETGGQAAVPASQPSHTILLIEDNDDDRAAVKNLLTRAGYGVLDADSGEKGLSLANEQRPSLIVLDVMMPDMDGWEVLGRLKSLSDTAEIPVIITSVTKDVSTAQVLGASAYLQKPIDSKTFLTEIDLHLRNSKTAECKTEHAGPSILLVEDNDVAALQIRLALEENGYSVRTAVNGADAMLSLGDDIPDAIVLDLMMPKVDGFQVLDWIRATPMTSEIPVLVVTAKELTTDELSRLSKARIHELVQKGSIDKAQLVQSVNSLLEKSPQQAKTNPITEIEAKNIEPNPEEPKPKPEPKANAVKSSSGVVLVVEDNPDNRFTIKAILDEIGCKHQTAVDGEEAVTMAIKIKPALVLMDINLPKLSGIDATKIIKADPELKHIPIVALTAKAMKGDRKEIIDAGCDDYLAKPVDPTSVMTMILKWVG